MIETAIILAMVYGLRRSEIIGLKWKAIDFENNTIHICHTVTHIIKKVAHDNTKNKSSNRILPLNEQVKAHLQDLKAKQLENKSLLRNAYIESEYVNIWPDGHEISPNYLTNSFKRLLKDNNLPDIRLHDLRHSCASYMLKMGCNLKDISDWLGHGDIKTTMNIYAHLDMDSKKEVANKFATVLTL